MKDVDKPGKRRRRTITRAKELNSSRDAKRGFRRIGAGLDVFGGPPAAFANGKSSAKEMARAVGKCYLGGLHRLMDHPSNSGRAASWMLALCVANIAPASLVAALGFAAAASRGEEERFHFSVAFFVSLLVIDLPLLLASYLLQRRLVLGKVFGLALPVLLIGILVMLVLNVAAGEFVLVFKALSFVLSVVVGLLYGWGLVLGIKAIRA